MLFKCDMMYLKSYNDVNSKSFKYKLTLKENITDHILFSEVKQNNSPF